MFVVFYYKNIFTCYIAYTYNYTYYRFVVIIKIVNSYPYWKIMYNIEFQTIFHEY